MNFSRNRKYADYLLLPFTDETNGFDAYGGGRHMELDVSDLCSAADVDFNKCYNPYYACNSKCLSSVSPKGNSLNVKIEAGVKGYNHHRTYNWKTNFKFVSLIFGAWQRER